MKRNLLLGVIVFLLIQLPIMLSAQSLRDAVDAYNEGAKVFKENPTKALELLYRAMEISTALGEEGDETKILAQSLIPRTHMELAMSLYREKKMYETLEQLEKGRETALKFGDETTRGRIDRIIPQLYNQMGNNEFRAQNFKMAIDYYKKAIGIKPDYVDPFVGISLSFESLGDFESMLEYLKKTIEVANTTNERAKADDAQRKAKAFLLRSGDEAQRAERFQEAIKWFTQVLEFDTLDATAYYLLAVNHNSLRNWDQAIENATLALERDMTNIKDTDIYYQLGFAYQGKGNNAQACEYYGRVTSGSFIQTAQYQIQHVLKCP